MWNEGWNGPDGVLIARSVRELARQARRTLALPFDESEIRELFESIESLERQLEPGTSADLGRWLASLRRCVEDQSLVSV